MNHPWKAEATNNPRDILTAMTGPLDQRFRLIGLLPLAFFLAQAIHYWRVGGIGNLLWMCNVGNLLLALGLFLNHRELIRAAAIWTIPGLVIWARYVLFEYDFVVSSALAHVGGIIVGLIVLRRVRMDRTAWFYAFVWYLFMQVVSRLTSDPRLNVNLAHRIQTGWENAFSSYWKFWIVMTMLAAFCLWAIGRMLLWIWPVWDAERSGTDFSR
ncbi:MAG TPA: hypothetical protein VN956_12420 [Pyrinomonadaceae bacterium]|nr:hypothetical protein [Pyrinomonadaceae bacterium]